MLDFGWIELLVIMVVAIFIIGPQELPTLMRAIGRLIKRFRYIKYNISRQFDELIGDDFHDSVNFEANYKDLPEGHTDFNEEQHDEESEEEYILPLDPAISKTAKNTNED